MDCHTCKPDAKPPKATPKAPKEGVYERIVLVGTPNVGKSVLFGLLTGKYATVSNYPGTTVEVTQGNLPLKGRTAVLVDTPGAYSLTPMSEDEQVTRDILLAERPAKVIQVTDTKNLRRGLSITLQLAEMNLPVALDLNMEDEALERGITVDLAALSVKLGIPVVSTVAPERRGLKELRDAIESGPKVPLFAVLYPDVIEECITRLSALMPKAGISARSLALMVLSKDETLKPWLSAHAEANTVEEIERLRAECRQRFGRSLGQAINEARMRTAAELADSVTVREPAPRSTLLNWLGRTSMHPLWGIPVLLGVLYMVYQFVGVLGADILVGLVEETVFGEYLNPMFIWLVEKAVPVTFFRDMLVGDYGLVTMALTYAIGIILPITTTFFIAFSILEDSGYLPRLAIMSNRIFNIMGLSGKAVLPMVLGLGCGTMAVMTTRVLDTKRDRIIATFLLALAVPCAAQLGVIMGIVGGMSAKALMIWTGIVVGMLLVSGFLASLIIKGDRSDFMMEIPPMRVPGLGNVLRKTGNRAVWYLKEAVPLFIYGTLALFLLDRSGLLGYIERALSPVITGMLGLPTEATGAFLIGFFRRDYGAAGFYDMSKAGALDPVQTVVSLVTLTLFVPCLAHFLMMIKERGGRAAAIMLGIIVPLALAAGTVTNLVLRGFGISLD